MLRRTLRVISQFQKPPTLPSARYPIQQFSSRRIGRTSSRASSKPKQIQTVNPEDPWTEVVHEESKQTYWWNQITNETTPLGAPKPANSLVGVPPPSAAPAPQQSGGMMSGLGSTLAEGMAFGVGTSLARHAVGSLLGGFGGDSDSSSSTNSSDSGSGDSDGDWF